MKEMCLNCRHKGTVWRQGKKIPELHCKEPKRVENALTAWDTVMNIFDRCDFYEKREK